MIRVGLTGGIACGKSAVAEILRADHGIPVADADLLARQAVAPDSDGLQRVVARFGAAMLLPGGELDRAALARIVAADRGARAELEAIVHPLVFQAMDEFFRAREQERHPIAVVEATLLVETGQHRDRRLFHQIVVVTCEPETQVRRLMERRGMSEELARSWLAAQLPLSEKEQVADHVLRNEGTIEELRSRAGELVRQLRG